MKSLLVRLTLGLHKQDVRPDEQPCIEKWLHAKIVVEEENLYRLPSKFRAGKIGPVQNGVAYLQAVGTTIRDLMIASEDLGEAKEGDLVITQRLLGRRGTPQAKVIEIVGRAETYSVGYVAVREGRKGIYDIRTEHPSGVPISDTELAQYEEGTLFSISNQRNEIIRTLGNLSDPKVDEAIVLALYNKHDEFDEEVLKAARAFPKTVDAALYPARKDLRALPFCTIDPVTAKDFDDAICFDVKNYILYVAIADVSSYVEPFGPIDAEAIYRSFSIYLPHRSIPMLPRELSETLCSLQPHVDRLAYVFELHIDRESLEVSKSELYEAIIHSRRRFSYEEVDAFFEGRLPSTSPDETKVMAYLGPLRKLTDALKVERMRKGYDFRSSELEMAIDENHEILSTAEAEETPSHALIEDCMLLANKAAAARYDHGVFRIHESPSPAKLQILYHELSGIGIMIEPSASIKATISQIQEQARERGLESEVDTLIIRSQMQARYSPDNAGHFGLGFERYTHFTSPIRRYSDLIVHRLLKAIARGDTEEGSYVLRNIDALCVEISEKEREASDIEITFMQRKFARWAHKHIGDRHNARITGTEPVLSGEIHGEITGAKVIVNSPISVMLFDDIIVQIDNVNLATAKIYATVVAKVEEA